MTLSELLDALRSAPTAELLNEISQEILLAWARAERMSPDWRIFYPPKDQRVFFQAGGGMRVLFRHAWTLQWSSYGPFFLNENQICRLILALEQAAIAEARQHSPALRAWQQESMERLIEDVA